MRLSVRKKGLIIVALPLVMQVILVVTLHSQLMGADQYLSREKLAREMRSRVDNLQLHTYEVFVSMFTVTTPESAERKVHNIFLDLRKLESRLSSSKPETKQTFRSIKQELQQGLILLKERVERHEQIQPAHTEDDTATDVTNIFRFLNSFRALTRLVYSEFASFSSISADARQLIRLSLYGAIVINILTALCITLFFMRGIGARINRTMENMRRYSGRQPLVPPPDLTAGMDVEDEIEVVDRAMYVMVDDLMKAEKARLQFVAMVSHDLRTPLTSISSILELLTDEPLDDREDLRQLVTTASSEARRLIVLTSNLIDCACIDLGELRVSRALLKLDEAIDQSFVCVQALAQNKGIRLRCKPGGFAVSADRERIIQVLANVLTICVRSFDADTMIRVSSNQDESGMVRVTIQDDSAIGIEELGETPECEMVDLSSACFPAEPGTGEARETVKLIGNRDGQSKAYAEDKSSFVIGKQGAPGETSEEIALELCKAILSAHGGEIGSGGAGDGRPVWWFTLPFS